MEGSVFPVNNFVTFKNGMDEQMVKVGKKKAGRILDGRTWDEMPEVSNAR